MDPATKIPALWDSIEPLMPKWEDIPEEFKDRNTLTNPWLKLQSKWFFEGLKEEEVPTPKKGIDRTHALRHLAAIQGSFEPKHEHKMAAVAYLMSLWFETPTSPK